jgi:hypothetical protein
LTVAFRILAVVCAVLTLAGCERGASYRYKLSLSLDTPNGVVSAYNVVEVRAFAVSIPARGVMSKVTGEALFLDLGPGKRPLVALLTRRYPPLVPRPKADPRSTWGEKDPAGILDRLYTGNARMPNYLDTIDRFAKFRGPRPIATFDLPDLVTFADVNDPYSAIAVDPDDLSATLGPGVSWRATTIEATDAPMTTGIEAKLPWVTDLNAIFAVRGVKSADNLIGQRDFKKKDSF